MYLDLIIGTSLSVPYLSTSGKAAHVICRPKLSDCRLGRSKFHPHISHLISPSPLSPRQYKIKWEESKIKANMILDPDTLYNTQLVQV